MSNFFGDLIGRHKEQGSSRYAKPIVEPRPKARYEAEPEVPNESLSDQQFSVPVNTSAGEEFSRNLEPTLPLLNQSPNLLTQISSPGTIYDKEASRSERNNEMDVSEQIENATALPTGVFLNRLSNPDRNNKEDQKPGLPLGMPGIDNPGSNRGPLVADDLDLRVQSILHRLRSSERIDKSVDEEFSADKKAMLSTNSGNLDPTHSEQNDLSSNEKFDEPSLSLNGNKSLQDASSAAMPPPGASPEGQLNIPNWLTGMQSDINKRWQQINAKIESTKPVVNVTIGRVEVRAVQDTGLQASKSQKQVQKKPSGVMSLNDYLKSRDKEGRA